MSSPQSFSAGCFGKLPHVGDFVRHNASAPEVQAFDQWLQQGLLHAPTQLREKWDEAYNNAPAYHFLFYGDNPEKFLAGVFLFSRDKSERKYPFFVSLYLDRATLGEQLVPFTPVVLAPFFVQAHKLIHAAHGLEMREIALRTEALQVAVPGTLMQEARRHNEWLNVKTAADFWMQAFSRFDDPRKYLLLKNLTEILLPLRHRDPQRLGLGLRFPLGPEAGAHEAVFWLQLSFKLLGNPAATPIVFWSVPRQEKRGFLYLFFRPPAAKILVHLVQPELPSDHICELEEEGKAAIVEAPNALDISYRTLLESPEMTLDEMLMRV